MFDVVARLPYHHAGRDVGHQDLEVSEALLGVHHSSVGRVSQLDKDLLQGRTDVGDCAHDHAHALLRVWVALPAGGELDNGVGLAHELVDGGPT